MHKLLFVCTLGCVVTGNAFALDLSLNDAVDMIVAQSQDVKKAVANIDKASASLDAVNASRWFTVDATVSYMNLVNVQDFGSAYVIDLPASMGGLITSVLGEEVTSLEIPDNIFSAGVEITQPIYTFGKIGNALSSVRSAIKMADGAHDLTMRSVRYAAAEMYWTAQMTNDIVAIAQQDLKASRNARTKLTSAGRANRSNLVKIESDIATKEITVSDAEFNRDTAYRMLKILAGIDMDETIVLTNKFPNTFSDLDAPDTLDSTPQWDILDSQIEMYEYQAAGKRADGYPTLAALASYSYTAMDKNIDNIFGGLGSQSAYWGVALQVPIFSGGLNRANATIDVMNAESVRQDLDKSKKIVSEEYQRAIAGYNHLRKNLSGLKNARDLAATAYGFSLERFASGQTSAVELADVSAGLYQLDMALLNAKYKILMSAESVKKLGE